MLFQPGRKNVGPGVFDFERDNVLEVWNHILNFHRFSNIYKEGEIGDAKQNTV